MNFGKFNKKQLFTNAPGASDYITLEELYNRYGSSKVYPIHGVYINTKSNFVPEAPVVLIKGYYVNLPQHQLDEIKEILADRQAVQAINMGQAGFIIDVYHQNRYNKDCYKAVWCNYTPEDDDCQGDIPAEMMS